MGTRTDILLVVTRHSKWRFHDCAIALREADHILSFIAKLTNLKTVPSLRHKPSRIKNRDEVTSHVR
jgi:hypothetical protein